MVKQVITFPMFLEGRRFKLGDSVETFLAKKAFNFVSYIADKRKTYLKLHRLYSK